MAEQKRVSLQYRISNLIAGLFNRPEPNEIPAAGKAQQPEPSASVRTVSLPEPRGYPDANAMRSLFLQWEELFRLGVQRARRYKEYDDMDTDWIASLLDAVTDACLISDDGMQQGFKVEAKSAKYQNVIDATVEALNLQEELSDILRDTLKYGDNFVAPVFDQYMNIVDYENPHPSQIWVGADKHNRLLRGLKDGFPAAYQQKTLGTASVAGWEPWEMFHLKFAAKRRQIYSTKSFLEDIRAAWYKLKIIEESLVINRVTRVSPRLLHLLDMTGKNSDDDIAKAVDAYTSELATKRLSSSQDVHDTPAVDQDLVMTTGYRVNAGDGKMYPRLNDVRMLDPRNTGLKLDDVNHLSRKLFSRVSGEVVGVLGDRLDVSQQDIASSRLYTRMQTMLSSQFLTPLFNLALALKGYHPEEGDFKILFPNTQVRSSWRFADASFRQSMADGNDIQNAIISRKRVSQRKYGFSDPEWEAESAIIKQEQKDFAPPPNTKEQAVKGGNNSQ